MVGFIYNCVVTDNATTKVPFPAALKCKVQKEHINGAGIGTLVVALSVTTQLYMKPTNVLQI